MSHTCEILAKSLEKIEKYYYQEHVSYLHFVEGRNQVRKSFGLMGHWKRRRNRKELLERIRYIPSAKWLSVGTLREVIEHSEAFDRTYSWLNDLESLRTFDWYMSYRASYSILGPLSKQLFPPPVSERAYKGAVEGLKEKAIKKKGVFHVGGFYIKTNNIPTIADTWVFNQYRIKGLIEPNQGDVVIDAGAFCGETSLWFSKLVGDTGKVYAFEPFPKNISLLRDNISNNIGTDNVKIVTKGLYNRTREYNMAGIGAVATIVKQDIEKGHIQFTTLDDFVESEHLGKVDFIKMDIEGSETEALEGSIKTIKRFRPRLAISIYHKKDDITKIPTLIKNIEKDYNLYLRHCTPEINETILFARVFK